MSHIHIGANVVACIARDTDPAEDRISVNLHMCLNPSCLTSANVNDERQEGATPPRDPTCFILEIEGRSAMTRGAK